ncbi:hypothetical protein K9L67_04680 [Candidatus Woesearchaeota archaeon]|nr:hypothetical protein [Candidatus Woesearchaeota archaeon]MCF7901495.1 hypothetical protein [Candidatus Woesearchaeota archaeon]MCF8013917.1 hypothetical protein [Candidatus Woesearchaeota archaeon]
MQDKVVDYGFIGDSLTRKLAEEKNGAMYPVFIITKNYDGGLVEYLNKSNSNPYLINGSNSKEICANIGSAHINELSKFKDNIVTIVLDEEPDNTTPDSMVSIVPSTWAFLKNRSDEDVFFFHIDPGKNRLKVAEYLNNNSVKSIGNKNIYVVAPLSKKMVYDLASSVDVNLIRLER